MYQAPPSPWVKPTLLSKWQWIVVLLWCFPAAASAQDTPHIIILNSEAAVEKYQLATTEFQRFYSRPSEVIDLSSSEAPQTIEAMKDFLSKRKPDMVYCIGTKAYTLTQKAPKGTTILFSSVLNWRRFNVDRNTYGISFETSAASNLNYFRYFFPEIKTIGLIYNRNYNREWVSRAKDLALETGITLEARAITRTSQLEGALERLKKKNIQALWLISDPITLSNEDSVNLIFDKMNAAKIPVFTYDQAYSLLEPVLIISADVTTFSQQVVSIAMTIAANRKPLQSVFDPAGTNITLNLKRVKELNLNFQEEALDSVNTIVE